MLRLARQFLWLSPADCDPPHGLDMEPGGHDALKVDWLEWQFRESGFDLTKAALVGYPLDGRVQLLSGTHRHRAAGRIEGFLLPVTLFLSSDVRAVWGTDAWKDLIEDIQVEILAAFPVSDKVSVPDVSEQVDTGMLPVAETNQQGEST